MADPVFETYPLTRRVEGTWAVDPIQGRVEVPGYEEPTGEYGWRLRDAAGTVQAISPRAFPNRAAAHKAINGFAVLAFVEVATVRDVDE